MSRAKASDLSSTILALSILLYAFRGKLGAIFITVSLLLVMVIVFKQKSRFQSRVSIYAAVFLFIFAFIINGIRSFAPKYYLIIGYFTTALLLLDTKEEHYDGLWRWLKRIAIFEAAGVYIQFFLPNIYYFLMSIMLPNEVISSIRTRRISGYYTGFTREVSFTMFLIVVGLGLYLYDVDSKTSNKKWFTVVFLLGALLLSGKRATLLFFVAAFFIIQFIKSDSKLKLIKFTIGAVLGIAVLWVTYPWWSTFSAFSRINEFVRYFTLNDIVGMTSGRTVIYKNAIQLWNTNRWFGIGWGNFKYSVAPSSWYSGFDVHNCFLQILCEIGIVGLVFYSIICWFSVVNSIRCLLFYKNSVNKGKYDLAIFCCYLQIFFILYSLTEPILYEYTDYVLFFICFNCSNLLIKKRSILVRFQENK